MKFCSRHQRNYHFSSEFVVAGVHVILLSILLALRVPAELVLARPFGDQMVLPMECNVPVWGKARPGACVQIRFADSVASGRADREGNWWIELPPQKASAKGRELEIVSSGSRRLLRDVLVGELWLCSGQSNMDFPLRRAVGGIEEAGAAANFPSLRLLNLTGVHTAARRYDDVELQRLVPDSFFEGTWQIAGEKAALDFSAVAWWAGKSIHRAKGVPVGLIDNSVGGSGAEAWLPREVLMKCYHDEGLLGVDWVESERISDWARGRVKLNLAGEPGNHPFRPGFLFDSGVRWWRGFRLTGVIWYQGETNAEILDDAWNERLIIGLVDGWREALAQPDLRIFMVQLPRIGGNDPLRRGWPQFRAVQARAVARLNGVSLIQTMDLGWDSPDVHPPDKRPLGERVGAAAVR
jgi:sialate O-acetylesterase